MKLAAHARRSHLPYTDEWYAARRNWFGASEAAAVLGRSRWATPLHLYHLKRGEVEESSEETEAQQMGKDLEPAIINVYRRKTGFQVEAPVHTYIHADFPFIAATPDALAEDTSTFPVDAKSASPGVAGEFGEEFTDDLPEEYILQAQQQMLVTGTEKCDYPVLFSTRHFRIFTVHRNETLIDAIVSAETELWQRIQDGSPPEPTWQHRETAKLVRELYNVEEGRTIELSHHATQHWVDYVRLGQKIKDLEQRRATEQARVLYAMGNAAIANIPGGKRQITRKVVNRSPFSVAATSYVTVRERDRQ